MDATGTAHTAPATRLDAGIFGANLNVTLHQTVHGRLQQMKPGELAGAGVRSKDAGILIILIQLIVKVMNII